MWEIFPSVVKNHLFHLVRHPITPKFRFFEAIFGAFRTNCVLHSEVHFPCLRKNYWSDRDELFGQFCRALADLSNSVASAKKNFFIKPGLCPMALSVQKRKRAYMVGRTLLHRGVSGFSAFLEERSFCYRVLVLQSAVPVLTQHSLHTLKKGPSCKQDSIACSANEKGVTGILYLSIIGVIKDVSGG
jgi:hypothetical protein